MAYEAKQPVYLPVADFLQLEFYLMDVRPGIKPDAFVAELVSRWLAVEMERQSLRERGDAIRGFQWKNVFLPDGTGLRTSYRECLIFCVQGACVAFCPSLLQQTPFHSIHLV
jgi:hypothetical protein